jgi:DNA-binding MarR family transcriptional regulator
MAVSTLRGTALKVMVTLSNFSGRMSPAELRTATNVKKGLSRVLRHLEAQGLVSSSQYHGRRTQVGLTEAGREALATHEGGGAPAAVQGNKEARAEFAKPVKGLVNTPVVVDDSASPGIERVYTQGWVAASWVVN